MKPQHIHQILLTSERFLEADIKISNAADALHKLKFLGNTFISTEDLKEIEKFIQRLNGLAAKCSQSEAQKYIETNLTFD